MPLDDRSGAPDRDAATGAPALQGEPPLAGKATASTIRTAQPEDVPEILAMVRELAQFERSLHEVQATEAMVTELLFGGSTPNGHPAAFCHVVPDPDADVAGRRLAGFALWFLNTSTWTGRHGIYLEDLYIRPEFRGRGFGQQLMSTLARICVDRGYTRLEWWVLDWNTPALEFYRSLGARPMDEWTVHRLTGPALDEVATLGDASPQP